MKETVIYPVRQQLAEGVGAVSRTQIAGTSIHLPARNAPASVYLPELARIPYLWVRAREVFGVVLGAPLVEHAAIDGSFLLLFFTDAFYDALIKHIRSVLPPACSDCGSLALNRMLALSKKPGDRCPDDPAAKRLLWQLVCLYERPGGLQEAERALIAYLGHLPPRERQAAAGRCGAFADASARILYAFRKEG